MAKATKKTSKPAKPVKKEAKKAASNKAKQIITRKMLIGEIASKYPQVVEIMFKHGMHCIGCGMTAYETLEQGCQGHGFSAEQIDQMVDEMNQLLQ